jgi:hypothetical protein
MSGRPSSLLYLADELKSRGIPSLSVLIAQIAGVEDYADFRQLITEFLPEREQDILHEPTPSLQMAAFASYFEDRYFPLEDIFKLGDIEGYEELILRIPVVVMGMSWDDYDAIASDYRDGIQLMTYLLENPYDREGGVNVSLAEACEEHVPESLLRRVPETRLSPEEAHRLLDGTLYEGLTLWADRIFCDSGNFFLDTDYEYLYSSMGVDWEKETVEALTRDWLQAAELENRLDGFVTWLEEDLPGHFEELLNFVLEKREDGQTSAD